MSRRLHVGTFTPLTFLCLLLGMIVFSSAALWNGFPLLFLDSSSYIADAFAGIFAGVRPVTYSLFVKWTSLYGVSLWGPIFAQNLMLSFLLWRAQIELTQDNRGWVLCGIYLVSAWIFGSAWVQGQVTADAMTSISLLAFVLLCLPVRRQTRYDWMIATVFVLATLSHVSHLILASACFGFAAVTLRFQWKRSGMALAVVWILAPLLNAAYSGGFKPIESYQPFLLGRLYETGVLDRLLNEKCGQRQYLFCSHRPAPGLLARDWIWNKENSIFQTRGPRDNEEYAVMIRDGILGYPGTFLLGNARAFFRQITHYHLGDRIVSYRHWPWMEAALQAFFPVEHPAFTEARQQEGKLDFSWPNRLLFFSLVLTLVGILVCVWHRVWTRESLLSATVGMVFFGILANAAICSGLSMVTDRYQARVIWLLPTVFLIATARMISRKPS